MDNRVIVINKEKGITSFGICSRLRGVLGIKKIGHTGTLDPMAEGVLVICTGNASKLIDYMPPFTKKYTAGIRFGLVSDTQDIWGETSVSGEPSFTEEELTACLDRLTGTYMQKTPMYSARKVNGRTLYSYARNDEEVEIPEKEITVWSITLEDTSRLPGEAVISVECSKGTYIRQIISDLGEMLGCGAVMSSLIRTSTDGFDISQARTVDEIYELKKEGREEEFLLSPDVLVPQLPVVTLNEGGGKRIITGAGLRLFDEWSFEDGTDVRIYVDGRFLAVGYVKENILKPRKVFE